MRARPEGQEPGARRARAILWSCGIVGVFYLIVSYAQLYGFGAAAFGKVSAPLPQLASAVGLGWLGHFIAFGITCSMFACTLACLTAGSRMLLSFGHDGLLPRAFTHTSRHTHAPSTAVWAVAIPMTVIPIAYIAAGSTDTVLTGEEGTLATYGFMLAVVMLFVFYVNWIPQAVSNDIFRRWPGPTGRCLTCSSPGPRSGSPGTGRSGCAGRKSWPTPGPGANRARPSGRRLAAIQAAAYVRNDRYSLIR